MESQFSHDFVYLFHRQEGAELGLDVCEHRLDVGENGLWGKGFRLVFAKISIVQKLEGDRGDVLAYLRHIVENCLFQCQVFWLAELFSQFHLWGQSFFFVLILRSVEHCFEDKKELAVSWVEVSIDGLSESFPSLTIFFVGNRDAAWGLTKIIVASCTLVGALDPLLVSNI